MRRSLKDNKRLAAERRGEMELRFAKWEVSFDGDDDNDTSAGQSTDGWSQQNGKQGELKNLASANAAAAVESAGSSS